MKDAEVALIVGRRGTGKSVRARYMVRNSRRLIVLDPVDDWRGQADRMADTRELTERLRQGWSKGFRLRICPDPEHVMAVTDWLCRMLMRAQSGYYAGAHTAKVTLALDELNMAFPPNINTRQFPGVQRAILQGRHYGLEILGITQRPTAIKADFRSNARSRLIYPVEDHTDMEVLAKQVGPRARQMLADLRPYHCLHVRDGQVSTLRPCPEKFAVARVSPKIRKR